MEASDLLITSILILQVWLQLVCAQDYRQECTAWDQAVTKINRIDDEMVMVCRKNRQCTGVDCTGRYKYEEFFQLQSEKKEIGFCFGVALHPCRKPTDLHFYVETPHNNQTYQQNVSTTSNPYDTGIRIQVRGGHAELYVQVSVNHTTLRDQKYMEIEMQSKVKVRIMNIYDQWPENHQKVLIPAIMVPVPECDSSVVTPNYSPGTCMGKAGTTVAPITATPTPPPLANPCSEPRAKDGSYKAHICGQGEMCTEGYCVCLLDFIRVNGTCTPGSTPDTPFIITDGPATTKKSTTIIIVVCVAVVVFLGMVVLGFFIVKYRKYKARYGNHQLLGEEDANAPDDPLDDIVEDDPPLDLST